MPDTPRLSHVAEQVRSHDRDRFVTALFAPAARREDLFALYAFNLEIAKLREVVREPMMGQIRLQWWRDAIAAIGQGQGESLAHPVAGPLGEAIHRHGLDTGQLQRLIDSREADLTDEPPADLAGLEQYAEDSSAALTDLALTVLGAGSAAARRAGRHVGVAWALVGLLRAVPFHARLGRLTLPADRLAAHGVARAQVLGGQGVPGLARVAAEVADLARDHLHRARVDRGLVESAALPALLPARLADAHLSVLRRNGYALFSPGWPDAGRYAARLALSALLRRW